MSMSMRRLQVGWRNFFSSYQATHAITVTYNPTAECTVHIPRIHADLDKLHLYVDDFFYGSRAARRPLEKRCSFIGMIEHPASNAHVHMLWRVPADRHSEVDVALRSVWQRIRPSGTVDVQVGPDEGWARYVLKDHWGAALDDALLFVASRSAR